MIRLITEQDILLARLKENADPFLCRILCIADMYRDYPFADCWVQVQENDEKAFAYLSKMDGVITLFSTPDANFDEISSFISAVGANLVMCHKECAEQLGVHPTRTGIILKWQEQRLAEQEVILNPSLREVYNVLQSCKSEDFQPPLFEPFYLDMSHRVRHGGTKVVGVVKNEQLVACAMTIAETTQMAVIGAVAVKPIYQGQGLGKIVITGLLQLCSKQKQKDIYVHCNTSKNRQIYESIGFVNCGTWAEIECN